MPTITQTSQKTKTYLITGVVLTVLITVGLLGYFFVFIPAFESQQESLGKLEPDSPPGSLTYSLEDIQNKLLSGKETDFSQKKSAPSGQPGDTMISLESIYKTIPSNDKICKGTNAGKADCGIAPTSTPIPTSTLTPTPTPTPAPTPTPTPVDPNLVLYLPFDETSGTTFLDSSGKGNNGVCFDANCPVLGAIGKLNKAVNFDGINDNIRVPASSNSLSFSSSHNQEITMEFWINWVKNGSNPYNRIFEWNGNNGVTFVVGINETNRGIRLYSSQLGGWKNTGVYLTENQWVHLVFAYPNSDKKWRVYKDGSLAYTYSTSADADIFGDLYISCSSKGSECTKGLKDEFKIYNRALTNDEILSHYQSYK